uniref:SLED domain-containing protein n=1 Tax=Timema tahoe TaxID=61484 RepID=A0A7R9FLB6_9NEOP|nr:unnamed protein product [Timema tahoe]
MDCGAVQAVERVAGAACTSAEERDKGLTQHGLQEGMMLEVPHKHNGSNYWVASIVVACGPLLQLRYVGCEGDRTRDFWCDVTKVMVRPLGWCKQHKIQLVPPAELANKLTNFGKILDAALLDATTVPPHLLTGDGFTAVERVKQGMKLEVQDKRDPNRLWVATILENVGGRLLLRYDTPDSSSPDFWLFYTSHRLYQMDWAAEKGAPWYLKWPNSLKTSHGHEEWAAVMEMAKEDARRLPLPPDLFQVTALRLSLAVRPAVIANCFRHAHFVLLVDEEAAVRVLPAAASAEEPDDPPPVDVNSQPGPSMEPQPCPSTAPSSAPLTFTRPCDEETWKKLAPDCTYEEYIAADDDITVWGTLDDADIIREQQESSDEEEEEEMEEEPEDIPTTKDILKAGDVYSRALKRQGASEELWSQFYNNEPVSVAHKFEEGMKLEAVHPHNMAELCPATVVRVFNSCHFLVEIDSHSIVEEQGEDSTWLCTALHPYIFPPGWAKDHGLQLTHPKGWATSKEEFDWMEYLMSTKSRAAPRTCFHARNSAKKLGFSPNMKLEAVNPENNHQICVATIVCTVDHLLWLHLESNDDFHPNHIVSTDSLDIFPVGWCDTNSYRLKPPSVYQMPTKAQLEGAGLDSKKESVSSGSALSNTTQKSSWCPKIYFNHKCFSGPYLSKGKLAQLPKAVGPGQVTLVMKEVLSMLISVAYKSSRVLKELQSDGKVPPGMYLEVLKAK